MADWNVTGDGQRYSAQGVVTSGASRGTTVTASASAHTKGTWVEIVASTPYDAQALCIAICGRVTGGAVPVLVDIGIGAPGSETLLIPNVFVNMAGFNVLPLLCPLPLPAGTRIAARCQATTGSTAVDVSVSLIGGGLASPVPLGRAAAYGINTGTTRGTAVDPGTSANTKGVWAELTSGLANPVRMLTLLLGPGTAARASGRWLIDIGIGGAGSETVLIPNLLATWGSSFVAVVAPYVIGPLPVAIPAGTRLAARAQGTATSSTRVFDLAVVGFD